MAVTEQRAVTVEDGARIAYEVRADNPDALPILALHGVLVGSSNWIHQMLRLPQFRWYVPSLRGHGESSDPGADLSIEQAAFDMEAVLDAEGIEQAVVIGNSLGATVGLALGLLIPQRVLAMVLVEPSIPSLLPEGDGDRLSSAAREAQPFLESGQIDDALDIFLTPRVGADWREKVGRRRLAEWRHNVLSTPAWFDAVASFNPGFGPLSGIDIPTVVINGADTHPVYLELTEAVVEAVPDADYLIVEDAGHGVPSDNPEAFNTLLVDYLRRIGLLAE